MTPQEAHKPVLINDILDLAKPKGLWLDGTFGAGGYAKAFIRAGAEKIIGLDRDELSHDMAKEWIGSYANQIELHHIKFSEMDKVAYPNSLDGIVLDIGVSSMQLDQAERGFSFMKDGPLDMRMGLSGPSAADLCNSLDETELADILYHFGEERASRRIAHAIVMARQKAPLTRTSELAGICERVLPRKKTHDPHPATRSFQALRIAVNGELQELETALEKSVSLLKIGGLLVVVSFHSLEDRIVKKFMVKASGKEQSVNRYQPLPASQAEKVFEMVTKKPVTAGEDEIAENPRARSAKLRIARRVGLS